MSEKKPCYFSADIYLGDDDLYHCSIIEGLESDLAAANDKYNELHGKYEELYAKAERRDEYLAAAQKRIAELEVALKLAVGDLVKAGEDIKRAVAEIDRYIPRKIPSNLKEFIRGLKMARKIILCETGIRAETKGEGDV